MKTMTEFLQNLHAQGGKVGAILKRFNTVLRVTEASSGNATAACLSAAACAAYQTRLSKENFMELAGHIYEAERGPKVPNIGFTPLAQALIKKDAGRTVFVIHSGQMGIVYHACGTRELAESCLAKIDAAECAGIQPLSLDDPRPWPQCEKSA